MSHDRNVFSLVNGFGFENDVREVSEGVVVSPGVGQNRGSIAGQAKMIWLAV